MIWIGLSACGTHRQAEYSQNPQSPITTGAILRFFFVGILLFVLYYISDILLLVVAAIIFASAIEPVVRRLGRYRVHRVIAVILIYLAIAVALTVLLIFFMPAVVNDMISFLANMPQTISLQYLWGPVQSIGVVPNAAGPQV